MNIENRGESATHSSKSSCAMPDGHGEALSRARTLSPPRDSRIMQARGSISIPQTRIDITYAGRMDRRGMTACCSAFDSPPPGYQSLSHCVPFSPDRSIIDRNLYPHKGIRGSCPYRNSSNHILAGVDVNTSAPYTCARSDAIVRGLVPGIEPRSIPGDLMKCLYPGARRSMSYLRSSKGTVPCPRR